MMAHGSERSRQQSYREYASFRKSHPKIDISFLDPQARRERVICDYDHFASVLDKYISVANAAKESNVDSYFIVDVENDYVIPGMTKRKPQPHYWHKRNLRNAGCTEQEISLREAVQAELSAEYSAIKNQ